MNPMNRNGWGLAVAATITVAAILRGYGLDSGLWYDEIVTLVESARRPVIEILNYFPDVNVHPFYSLLAHASLETFGESAWALRLPACIFGVASIWMTYVLGARLIGRAEAWAGAAVLTVSYQHVWFSQNARGYTMMGFFALLSTHFLLRAIESKRVADYAFYALACAAGMYTHLTMAFVVAGHVAVIAGGMLAGWRATREVDFKPMLMTWAAAAILTVGLYAPFASEVFAHFGREGPKQAAQVATGRWAILAVLRNIVSGSGILGAAITALAALVGALSLVRKQPLALALLVVPALVAGIALVVLGQPIRPRFFFFLAGAVGIFAGRGVGAVADRLARPQHSFAFIVSGAALLVAFSAVGLRLNYRVPKQDFDGAVRYLEGQAAGGAVIAAADPACFPIERYYLKADWPCLRSVDDLQAVLATSQPVLVLYTLSDYIEAGLRDRLRGTCAESRRFPGTLGDGDVVICDPRRRAGRP